MMSVNLNIYNLGLNKCNHLQKSNAKLKKKLEREKL